MAVPSNQKVGELARIAYLALLHAEGELEEETNTVDGDTLVGNLRSIRSAILGLFSNTDENVDLSKVIYLIESEGSLVAYYHGNDTKDPDERLAKITRRSSAGLDLDLTDRK